MTNNWQIIQRMADLSTHKVAITIYEGDKYGFKCHFCTDVLTCLYRKGTEDEPSPDECKYKIEKWLRGEAEE